MVISVSNRTRIRRTDGSMGSQRFNIPKRKPTLF
jgi:hypothetical protein